MLFSVRQSAASAFQVSAAAAISIARAAAPALRIGSQWPRTAVDPPVAWIPKIGLTKALSTPACSTRTRDQSASSSSAISMGMAVCTPCPISERPHTTVMSLLGAMRRYALICASLPAARIWLYVPQRHTLPLMAPSMSASLGARFFASSAVALMIWPDWQYPHCGTSFLIQAACTALPAAVPAMPSIVVTFLPAAADTGVEQERTGWPSRCTVHAPHCAMPQPNLVPVRCSESRSTHRRGVSGATSTSRFLPLIVRETMDILRVGIPEVNEAFL